MQCYSFWSCKKLSFWPSGSMTLFFGNISLLVFISLSFWMLDMVHYRSGLWMMYSNGILVSRAVFDIFMDKDGDLSIPEIFIWRNHWIPLLWCEVMLEPKDRITFLIKQLPAEWLLNLNSTQYKQKRSGIVKVNSSQAALTVSLTCCWNHFDSSLTLDQDKH